MSFAKLLVVLMLLPATVLAVDSPWSVELDMGVGSAFQSLQQSGISERRGSRTLVDRREEVTQTLTGFHGATVQYRLSERLAGYARADWRAADNVDLDVAYAFANGDYVAGPVAMEGSRLANVMAGLRWSRPVAGCWSTELSADVRRADIDLYRMETDLMGAPLYVAKQEDSAVGVGVGTAATCRLSGRWSIALSGEAARLEDYSQYAAWMSLRWRIH